MATFAAQLFAQANGDKLEGDLECYFCGAQCNRRFPHHIRRPDTGVRTDPTLKRPGNPFMCRGCWWYNRPSLTVFYLNGGFKDRQAPVDQSWWIANEKALAVRDTDYQTLYDRLLKPPIPFALSLLDKRKEERAKNNLRSMIVNEPSVIVADTELTFTVNNRPFVYTVYELELALLQNEANGKSAGVRLLIDILGEFPNKYDSNKEPEKKAVGPPEQPHASVRTTLKKIVSKK